MTANNAPANMDVHLEKPRGSFCIKEPWQYFEAELQCTAPLTNAL